MTATDFDKIAKAYDTSTINPWNDLYERPASIALMGDVDGKHILDAGCGGGKHSADLLANSAKVSAFDMSANMLAFAKEVLGDAVPLKIADLSQKLPYDDQQFEGILCALALHYLEYWDTPLREFYRLLKPGGHVVISTHHPFMDHALAGGENYFAHTIIEDSWTKAGETMHVRYWRRSLSQMMAEFTATGFKVETIQEPMPDESTKTRFPDAYNKLTTQPRFIFFKLRKPD